MISGVYWPASPAYLARSRSLTGTVSRRKRVDGTCGKKPKVVLSSIQRALLRAHTYARAHTLRITTSLWRPAGQCILQARPLILDCLLEEHSVDFILGSHAGMAQCPGLGFPSLHDPYMHVSDSVWICFGGAANKVEALQETVKNVPLGSYPSV